MNKIKCLADLKREIKRGTPFIILEHYIKPGYTGQKRKPNVVQTNGFYSIVPGEPNNPVSRANLDKGSWIDYGKASNWKFEDNNVCTRYFENPVNGNKEPIWKIKFMEE